MAEICRRLDGIPLAIELAAARIKLLTVEQIAQRLDDRFKLLTADTKAGLPHQQTLRATIEWSYDHLDPAEQTMLRRLSVFAGGWTLEAATAVCGNGDEFQVLDRLGHLVNKSLVEVEAHEGSGSRYRLLETMRQYGHEKLDESGDGDATRTAHLDFYVALAEEADAKLSGSEQAAWLMRLDRELENVLAAHAWVYRTEGGAQKALRMASSLHRFWYAHGHSSVGKNMMTKALDHPDAQEPTRARARALFGSGHLAVFQGDQDSARALFSESLAISRQRGDWGDIARALTGLGMAAHNQSDFTAAREFYSDSLRIYQDVGDRRGTSTVLGNLGLLAWRENDLDSAQSRFEQSLALFKGHGDQVGTAEVLAHLGVLSTRLNRYDQACRRFAECLRTAADVGAKRAGAYALEGVAELTALFHKGAQAAFLFGASSALREAIGMPLEPGDVVSGAEVIEQVRTEMGADAFAREWATGRNLTFESAVSYALQLLAQSRTMNRPRLPL